MAGLTLAGLAPVVGWGPSYAALTGLAARHLIDVGRWGAVAMTGEARTLAQTDPTLWYLTRTLGVAAYVALSLTVFLGMLRSIARTSGERLTWVVDELHAVVATLAGLLIVGHLLTIKFDDFVPFSWANLLLPGDQPYRPLGVNLGILGLYALVGVLLSSWLRRRTSYRFWRGVHYVGFVAFALVTAHGILAGSDADEVWLHAIYIGAACGIGFLVFMRLISRGRAAGKPA
jgi:predicted ferric reductase